MSSTLQTPVVTVAGGALEGRTSGGVTSFLGIPYAAAPFGENRMRQRGSALAGTIFRHGRHSFAHDPGGILRIFQ